MKNSISKEERVLRVINRKSVDYLPNQINFANRNKVNELCNMIGFGDNEEFNKYLENHFYLTTTLNDKPKAYRDSKEEIEILKKQGYAYPDWDKKIVYDTWGVGFEVFTQVFIL